MNLFSVRYGFGSFREMVSKYRMKSRQNRANLVSYWNRQRERISDIRKRRMPKPVYLWCIFLSLGFLFYYKKYGKQLEINKILNKLDRFYSTNIEKQKLKDNLVSILVIPKTVDQLTHLIVLSQRYHYKIIVESSLLPVKAKIAICQELSNRCLFINISYLKRQEINEVNSTIDIEAGSLCGQVNQNLQKNGYQPIFHSQFQKERVYDIISNNLPLLKGPLANEMVALEMISATGSNFRSASETNKYGQIPSLNSLFLGMGGHVALPSSITIRINKSDPNSKGDEKLRINIKDRNEKINALRKLDQINKQLIEVQLTNINYDKNLIDEAFLLCKSKLPRLKQSLSYCASLSTSKNIPVQNFTSNLSKNTYNLFFSVNQQIFEQFLLKYDKKLGYSLKDGLLKVRFDDEENEEKIIELINDITNDNGALVWCKNRQVYQRIKRSLYSSEIGAELMRKIVEVRKSLDPRGLFYSQNRYEDYFKKGIFRKLTEIFW